LLLKKLLAQFGLEPERLRVEWISASEGDRFATIVNDLTEEIKRLGPSPLRPEGPNNG
jgi:F420-non-reducing hydrogenase iron-sulfur subunit